MRRRPGAEERLEALWSSSPRRPLGPSDRVVILSDLHMGAGDSLDDFLPNGELCLDALENYYLPRGYHLILNGDIEELLRVPRQSILLAWPAIYAVFEKFRAAGRLTWLRGNHEILPGTEGNPFLQDHFDGESLILETLEGPLFVFHGHQAGIANSGRYNGLIGWSLRSLAHPLGIGNRSIAHDSAKKFKLEKAVHAFSKQRRIVSVIGHTHRPLFESLPKAEALAHRLEALCRDYAEAGPKRRQLIRATVLRLRAQAEAGPPGAPVSVVYGKVPVPCVFNSGCAVGKRGFTTLEVKNGKIALVFWSSPDRSWLPAAYNEFRPSRCFGRGAYRTILRRESLAYVFSRIELLGGPG